MHRNISNERQVHSETSCSHSKLSNFLKYIDLVHDSNQLLSLLLTYLSVTFLCLCFLASEFFIILQLVLNDLCTSCRMMKNSLAEKIGEPEMAHPFQSWHQNHCFFLKLFSLFALKNGTDFIYTDPATSPRRLTAVNNKNIKPDLLKRSSDSGVN